MDHPFDDPVTGKQVEQLTNAITRIAYGPDFAPTGIEALVMGLCGSGDPGHRPLVVALEEIAAGLHDIAEAIRERA